MTNEKKPFDEATVNSALEDVKRKLLTGDMDLAEFMELIVNQIKELTSASGVVVEIVDNDEMVYRAANGTVKDHIGLRLKAENSFSGLCVKTLQVLICHNCETDDRVNKEACRKVGAKSMVVVPLMNTLNRKFALGVLKIVSSEPNAFNDDDVKTLQLMARFLATALTNQMLKEVKDFF